MEKIKRKVNINLYLMALVITLTFFLVGIAAGNYFAKQKQIELEISQKAISSFFDLFDQKMQRIQNEDLCNLSWADIWKEKVSMGEILSKLENRFGKNNEDVIKQKALYNELQYKISGLIGNINDKCNYQWDIIIFFYTNDKKNMQEYDQSGKQGLVLDTLYESNKDKIKILSFDISAESNGTEALIDKYDITQTPYLIINDKGYSGLMTKDEIQQILKE